MSVLKLVCWRGNATLFSRNGVEEAWEEQRTLRYWAADKSTSYLCISTPRISSAKWMSLSIVDCWLRAWVPRRQSRAENSMSDVLLPSPPTDTAFVTHILLMAPNTDITRHFCLNNSALLALGKRRSNSPFTIPECSINENRLKEGYTIVISLRLAHSTPYKVIIIRAAASTRRILNYLLGFAHPRL